eukprot:2136587-Rhodomonas_salina.1
MLKITVPGRGEKRRKGEERGEKDEKLERRWRRSAAADKLSLKAKKEEESGRKKQALHVDTLLRIAGTQVRNVVARQGGARKSPEARSSSKDNKILAVPFRK